LVWFQKLEFRKWFQKSFFANIFEKKLVPESKFLGKKRFPEPNRMLQTLEKSVFFAKTHGFCGPSFRTQK